MLRNLVCSALLTVAAMTGAGAKAAIVINQNDVGSTLAIDYAGTVLGIPTAGLGAIANFVYTGASSDGKTFNFSYDLTNDSTLTSKVRSFGFDVLGTSGLSAVSSTGTYSAPIQSPLSGLIGNDVCLSVATLGTCTTGSGGLSAGQSATGTFALTFATVMSSIELSDFRVNFQGVNGLLAGTGTGSATLTVPVSAAPEPATWAMMILGFGMIGWLMRRRGVSGAPVIVSGLSAQVI